MYKKCVCIYIDLLHSFDLDTTNYSIIGIRVRIISNTHECTLLYKDIKSICLIYSISESN